MYLSLKNGYCSFTQVLKTTSPPDSDIQQSSGMCIRPLTHSVRPSCQSLASGLSSAACYLVCTCCTFARWPLLGMSDCKNT